MKLNYKKNWFSKLPELVDSTLSLLTGAMLLTSIEVKIRKKNWFIYSCRLWRKMVSWDISFLYTLPIEVCVLSFWTSIHKAFHGKILIRVIQKGFLAKILIKVSFMKVLFWKIRLMIGVSISRVVLHPGYFLSNVVRKTAMQTGLNGVFRPL